MNKNSGLTLIELIAVLVIMGIIASIATFYISNSISNARLEADQLSVIAINEAVSYYNINNYQAPINELELTDEEIIQLLVEDGFLSNIVIAQSNNASIAWDDEISSFHLVIDNIEVPLSPYGDTFEEIAPQIISDIQQKFEDDGVYGRSWGDYRYTDVGLDPADWDHPILHITYTPSGSSLKIEPEDGYEFIVDSLDGDPVVIKSVYNWNVIYNDLDGLWYYHSIDESNLINIDTLIVQQTI